LKHEINYQNNLPEGLARYYRANGRIFTAGAYAEGLKHGEWKIFNTDGTIDAVEEWERGVLVSPQHE
jgi:antitoxin component YwqK of YwqJK toxin-antitoxin module